MSIDIRVAHLFSALTDEQIRQISETSRRTKLDDGQALFDAGTQADRFYLVANGQIKLFRLSASGDEKIIDIILPGNTFAEAVMFMERPTYPVSATALGPARVISFESRRFLSILAESSETCFRIMGTMSQRLRGLIKEIDDLTLQSASTRMCALLLALSQKTGSARFTLPAAKGVLAARLSMKPETFSRIFQNLATKGIIATRSHEVTVLDPERLRVLAHVDPVSEPAPTGTPSQNPCPLAGPKAI